MAKILDLNSAFGPTMELVLCDKDRTHLTLTTPTEGMVDELKVLDLKRMAAGDREAVESIYDLAARLINRNREGVKVTGKTLRSRYGMSLWHMVAFFEGYLDFINEVGAAKN